MAKLYFRYGVIGSGKTVDLIKVKYNYILRNMNAVIIKPLIDTKGNDYIVSRDQKKIKVDFLVNNRDNIYKLVNNYLKYNSIDCILVDEVQFLKINQIDQLSDIVDFLNIPVICYGLRTDFKSKLFQASKRLFEIADTLEEIKTVCHCNHKATINVRKADGKMVFQGKQILIDGDTSIEYDSMCRKCFKECKKAQKSA